MLRLDKKKENEHAIAPTASFPVAPTASVAEEPTVSTAQTTTLPSTSTTVATVLPSPNERPETSTATELVVPRVTAATSTSVEVIDLTQEHKSPKRRKTTVVDTRTVGDLIREDVDGTDGGDTIDGDLTDVETEIEGETGEEGTDGMMEEERAEESDKDEEGSKFFVDDEGVIHLN